MLSVVAGDVGGEGGCGFAVSGETGQQSGGEEDSVFSGQCPGQCAVRRCGVGGGEQAHGDGRRVSD